MRYLLYLVLIGSVVIFSAGCEKHTRYKVLTFFFTGVPPLEKIQLGGAGSVTVVEKKRRWGKQSTVFIHGPKAAGECFQCHNTSSTKSFRSLKVVSSMPRLGKISPGRLVAPVKKLCIQCHITKSTELAYTSNLWLHGPLADGNCILCHDYHQTKNEYMLYTKTTNELCGRCHAEGFIGSTKEHNKGRECVECHNAHLGANRFLLKKDYDEVF